MHKNRKSLPHDIPLWVDLSKSVYFLTACAEDREAKPFSDSKTAEGLLDSIRYRHENRLWFCHIAVVMPDHVHLLASFSEESEIQKLLRNWKHWTAHQFGFRWQRDFFEHRLRSDESLNEKAAYIFENPVRAGLVEKPADWPYRFVPGVTA